MTRALPVLVLSMLAACPSNSSGDGPDGGMGDDDGDGGMMQPDAPQCSPACESEANADVACTVFQTCESTCETGYSRCGDSCVAESPTQCGAGCDPCRVPTNGAGTCSDGVCGVTCNAGYVPCETYSGMDCCAFASEVIAPADMGGYMPSIAVDAQNQIHLAYYRSAEHELVYTEETAAGMTRETARWYWSSGGNARFELGLGARGPVILYTYPNSLSGLYLAERRSTGWSHSALVEGSTPPGFSLATDRGGRAHVCFTSSTGALSYALREGDQWTVVPVGAETEAKGACAIAVDHEGLPHIAFARTTAGDVAYAKGDASGNFTTMVADGTGTVGGEVAIAVAPDGTPSIVAYRSDTQELHVVTRTSGVWASATVANNLIASPRIAIDTAGAPMVTWFDYGQYRVMIATRSGATWTRKVFDSIAGGAGALAPAPDGSMWIATGDREVLAHQFVNGSATSYGIDFEDKAGSDVVLLHRTPQQPVMIYDTTHDNVRSVEVATKSGPGWTRAQLATPGSGAVAALDATGKVRIAYQTSGGLSYAAESGASFTIESIAATASEPGIAVDAQGTPYVAYVAQQGTTYSLVLATRGASGWTPTTIGAAAAYGTYRKPVVRVVGGVVHLLWFDSVAKTIVYASSADSYTKVTVEPTADGGHDLYVTPAGVPHACVFRTGSSWPTLRYATRATTSWSNIAVAAPGTRLDSGVCGIRGDANGTIAIARSVVYGAGLGQTVLTTMAATPTHVTLQDDFYSRAIGVSVGANGFEVAAIGQPYSGSSTDQNRVRWAHK